MIYELSQLEEGQGKVLSKANTIGEISDGYHTFDELYDYRMIYNALLINSYASQCLYNCHKSKRHFTKEECFGGGWFIVTMNLPSGQVSNHYEMKYWDYFHCEEREFADEWDGHTPQEAYKRMIDFAKFFIKKGWELSAHATKIMNLCEKNDGYCPCGSNQLEGEDKKCPCKDYRENDICHCNMYLKSQ